MNATAKPTPPHAIRVGLGCDVHRLDAFPPAGEGRPLVVGGVAIASDRGPVAHSDGDALMHALTDALLGALALPDIGECFPDTDPANEGQASERFLREAARLVAEQGYRVVNADCVVNLQAPKLAPHKAEIRRRLAGCLGVDADLVNVKGKSGERVGPVGEGRAIEAHAVALLARVETAP